MEIEKLKKFLCIKDYYGIEVGDIVSQGYNIEGSLLYFAEIKNSIHETTMFFPNQIENNIEHFSEIKQ